ncbi:MAG: hypothetical protein N4A33_10125 [Bacteriovoracaceae bacterium]|nr:hypothetical protein [Bacteriovoracaceae bacterium]
MKKVFRERLILLEDEIIVINRNYTSKFKLVKIKEIELNIMHSPGGVWLRVDYFEDQKEDFVNFDFMQSALIDFAKWAKLKSEGRIQVKSNVDIDKEHSFWICNYGVLAPFWLVTIVITILKFLY